MEFENTTFETFDSKLSGVAAINSFFSSVTGYRLHASIYYVLNPIIMLTSMCSNGINVTVFIRGRITDSMALVFLGLAVSDLLYSACGMTTRLLNAASNVFGESPYLNLYHMSYIVAKYANIWFFLSPLLTTLAAVQKCACVAVPFFFRNYFTQRRSAINVILLYTLTILYHLPYLGVDKLAPYHDIGLNRTRLGYVRRLQMISIVTGNISRIAIPFVSQALVITCVIIMTVKLQTAATARRSMTSPGMSDEGTAKRTNSGGLDFGRDGDVKQEGNSTMKSKNAGSNDLSAKELRVIQSVNIICIIFIAGMTPTALLQALSLSFDDFSTIGALSRFKFFLDGINETAVLISMAVNIFVYYKYNTKYKTTFTAIFLCCSRK